MQFIGRGSCVRVVQGVFLRSVFSECVTRQEAVAARLELRSTRRRARPPKHRGNLRNCGGRSAGTSQRLMLEWLVSPKFSSHERITQ